MATSDEIRVGDADRDAVAASLREHFAEGRLTLDELNQRLDATFAAKTRADLDDATRELPHIPRPGPVPPLPQQDQRGGRQRDWQGGRRRARIVAPVMLLVLLTALLLLPHLRFGFLGWGPGRFLVILLAVFAVIRRLIRGLGGTGGCPAPRRRRRW